MYSLTPMLRFPSKVIVIAFLLAVTSGSAAGSADLRDYYERVSASRELLEELKEEGGREQAYVDHLKQILPESEQVEYAEKIVTVDNRWLHTSLDAYIVERDPSVRENMLDEGAARLDALGHLLLSELSEDSVTTDPKTTIRDILSRSEYRTRKEDAIGAFIKDVRRRAIEFIQNIYMKIWSALLGGGAETSWVFRALIICGIVGALVLVVRALLGRPRRPGSRRREPRTILGEKIEEGATADSLADAAVEAARAGDFRTAVRKLYISLLHQLADLKLLELDTDSTNHEYVSKLSGFTALMPPLRYLTDRFDYVWYGMFQSNESDFAICMTRYREAMSEAESAAQRSHSA